MPFKSRAQRRKFAQLLVEGKISNETFEEWNRETGGTKLPERVAPKTKSSRAKSSTKRTAPQDREEAKTLLEVAMRRPDCARGAFRRRAKLRLDAYDKRSPRFRGAMPTERQKMLAGEMYDPSIRISLPLGRVHATSARS
jgi:hypothetical protein